MIIQAYRALRSVWKHPLCMKRHSNMLYRFVKWHIAGRLAPGDIAVEWVNGTKFLARPWHFGFSANVYCGLLEYADMSFLLHALRPDDWFFDIGANRGSYTVLAGAAVGAKVIAAEPVPDVFLNLLANVNLNAMAGRVECFNIGLGEKAGTLVFTSDAVDCINHVVSEKETTGKTVTVPVQKLDDLAGDRVPFLIKIDVEGYEWFVLQGGLNVLGKDSLKAIIIEFNNTGLSRYGVGDDQIHRLLKENGFDAMAYDPGNRTLAPLDPFAEKRSGNVIYVRDLAVVQDRLKTGPSYQLFGRSV
ncbi:MAG: FkbM family methyltransferase [Lentisphaerae bacterium]|jgi:FkbM family methyltransferase|nr:FkbM family methyltransferase [Lentisphaerota bacterium]